MDYAKLIELLERDIERPSIPKTEYIILAGNVNALEQRVNDRLAAGWTLCGGVTGSGNPSNWFYQAMTKTTYEEKK